MCHPTNDNSAPEEVERQRAEVTAAFELAVRQVGVAVNATQLWLEYINYVKGALCVYGVVYIYGCYGGRRPRGPIR